LVIMKLGLVVNPIAGMGGRVGLKGTDNVLSEAVAMGAEPVAPKRAVEFLQKLRIAKANLKVDILTCPSVMGEDDAKIAKYPVQLLSMSVRKKTSAEETKKAIRLIADARVDLIVFVGGDGTARDVRDALEKTPIPVLGIPSGVKMYSGIFATNPADAVDVVIAFVENRAELTDFEIMDADETLIRRDQFAVKLYGLMKGPFVPNYMQGSKELSSDTSDEKENQNAIAKFIIEQLPKNPTLILGPGTTIETFAEHLGFEKTLLGVDVYSNDGVILDVSAEKILENVKDWTNTWIVLSPIGRQGILLGRGNQQISPEIIKRVGKEHIIVAATKTKLRDIDSHVLRVDTGDMETDEMLAGYVKVYTDYKEWRLVQVQ
jgi:predicted polyphosphate/ATP-dependent NAD kinase